MNPILKQAYDEVRGWLRAIYSPSQIDKAVLVRPDAGQCGSIHVKIWTSTNEYRVCVSPRPTGGLEDAYMGASASTRKPRAGEAWTRGNDLPDGNFSKELWQEIMVAIVKYEAQEVKSESWKDDARLLG